jgi:hypothetical protein
MSLKGFVKFIFKSTDEHFQYSQDFPCLLPDQSVTIESSCIELSVHQYFHLFKNFLSAVEFNDLQIMEGATELAFNDMNREEDMQKVAKDNGLILEEDIASKIKKYEDKALHMEDLYLQTKHKAEKEILNLKARISRLENPDDPQYTDSELDAMFYEKEPSHYQLSNAHKTCRNCGLKYGTYVAGVSSWWNDVCDVCGKEAHVTETRDFDYFNKTLKSCQNDQNNS